MPPFYTTARLATYNIRFDNPDDPFSWFERHRGLAHLILTLGPDVIGLQEVLKHQLGDLEQTLPAYTHVGVGRGPTPSGEPYAREHGEYNPLFYRSERLKLLKSGTFWLSPTPDVPGSRFAGSAFPRIATWAQLELRREGRSFYVFNTHLPYEQDERGVASRALAAKVLLSQIARIAGDATTVLMGDFNLSVRTDADRLQTYAQIRERFEDAYEIAAKREGPDMTFFGFDSKSSGEARIDYIFVSSGTHVLSCRTVLAHNGTYYFSDHAPVTCEVYFS